MAVGTSCTVSMVHFSLSKRRTNAQGQFSPLFTSVWALIPQTDGCDVLPLFTEHLWYRHSKNDDIDPWPSRKTARLVTVNTGKRNRSLSDLWCPSATLSIWDYLVRVRKRILLLSGPDRSTVLYSTIPIYMYIRNLGPDDLSMYHIWDGNANQIGADLENTAMHPPTYQNEICDRDVDSWKDM